MKCSVLLILLDLKPGSYLNCHLPSFLITQFCVLHIQPLISIPLRPPGEPLSSHEQAPCCYSSCSWCLSAEIHSNHHQIHFVLKNVSHNVTSLAPKNLHWLSTRLEVNPLSWYSSPSILWPHSTYLSSGFPTWETIYFSKTVLSIMTSANLYWMLTMCQAEC